MKLQFLSYRIVLSLVVAVLMSGTSGAVFAFPQDNWEATIARLEGRAALSGSPSDVSAQEAYAKLLEGQRHAWAAKRTRSAARATASVRSARIALVAAVDADPGLSEAYTALAELEILRRVGEAEVSNAIRLATLALRNDGNNFGARRVMARLLSLRANLARGQLDRRSAEVAAVEWRKVAELDPRNTEAWAFLSVIYEKLGEPEKKIEALRKWVSSSGALESQYYQFIVGVNEDLAPERASVRLASDLLALGRVSEALEVVAPVVSDQPGNTVAVNILRDVAEQIDENRFEQAAEPLTQAVATDPNNVELANTLARLYRRRGMQERAVTVYSRALQQLSSRETRVRARLLIGRGDLLAGAGKYEEAILSYSEAFEAFGSGAGPGEQEVAREAARKMIVTARVTGDTSLIETALQRAARRFGGDDSLVLLERSAHLRETGKRIEALALLKGVAASGNRSFEVFRAEVSLLVETGKVEDAVALIRSSTRGESSAAGGPRGTDSAFLDSFTASLLITGAYISGKKAPQAMAAAEDLSSLARGNERRQLATISKATAANLNGDRSTALQLLRSVLEESPNNPIALNNLGYYLLDEAASRDEGIAMIRRAVSVDPRNASYLHSLGKAMLQKGELDNAGIYLFEAVAIEPGSLVVWEQLGELFERRRAVAESQRAFQRALRMAWNSDDKNRLLARIK
ncbi:MAG: tetratricopeptide repeat protein [Acidobacteria bacterium]|nr:tetratricopeptide repeat protein [Acidobacteriota bacterium]